MRLIQAIVICCMVAVIFHMLNTGETLSQTFGSVPTQSEADDQPKLDNHTYGLVNVAQIAAAGRDNQANFDAHYKNFRFDAVMPFNSSNSELMGGYRVYFGKSWMGEVACRDIFDMHLVSGWSKGQMVRITGIVDETSLGIVLLRNCSMTTYHPQPQSDSAPPVVATVAPSTLPAPAATAAVAPSAPSFQRGHADRQSWENWISPAVGDYRSGALWWAAHRSVPNRGCQSLSGAANQGCIDAKAVLDPFDANRKSDPDYKAGWNS
jgi:hypothetical protein